MTETPQELPIVRLTRWQVGVSMTGRGKKARTETERWTYYGVDATGQERIYAEHTSKVDLVSRFVSWSYWPFVLSIALFIGTIGATYDGDGVALVRLRKPDTSQTWRGYFNAQVSPQVAF